MYDDDKELPTFVVMRMASRDSRELRQDRVHVGRTTIKKYATTITHIHPYFSVFGDNKRRVFRI